MTEILNLLARIERQYDVRILYACESGSRAWGFASPDSDYDIRFIFVRASDTYLSVQDHFDTIELPLEGLLDAGGWDVRKSLRLLAKSNGAVVEWLHSPIVYREDPGFLNRWRQAAHNAFSPKASSDHYRGLGKQMILGKLKGDSVRAKDYLYAMRALLAACWVSGKSAPPPVPFADLLELVPPEIMAEISRLLEYKAGSDEGERMARIPAIDGFLQTRFLELEDFSTNLDRGADTHRELDQLLRDCMSIRGLADDEQDASALRSGHPACSPSMKPKDFTVPRVRDTDLLLFDTVAGSRAYGTSILASDEDRRGVFVAPETFLLGMDRIEQTSDERGDEIYYELGRFAELLLKNNPNALELLAMPDDCIRFQHPLFSRLKPELFLSKLCSKTFGEYAVGQIRKARGLNKKIVNPQPEKRRALLDFCHVPEGQGSVSVLEWLRARGLDPKACGLTAVQHAAGSFAIYNENHGNYRGLVSPKDPDSLVFSSVAFDASPVSWMYFNKDAFQAHCKAHREYWEWVENRNDERFQNNSLHGRGYDSKNMLHTMRLLDMAKDIALEGVLRIRRPDRDFLLKVRAGDFQYEELVALADEKLCAVASAFKDSTLPETPDRDRVNNVLVRIRREWISRS